MQGLNVPDFNKTLFNFFQKIIPQKGLECGFVKRKSKLNSLAFVKAVIASCLSAHQITLEGMCSFLRSQDISLSKQGLHQRMNEHAVSLFRELFSQSLNQFRSRLNNNPDFGSIFAHVYIIDSSTVSLPNSLKNIYKGCGGNASQAAIKMQVLYDYIEGQIQELTLTQGCENDQGFDDYFAHIKANALYLMDLGYFKLRSFQKIIAGHAYFISRYFIGANLQTLDNQPLDLLDVLQHTGSFYSQEVLLGAAKIKVRLIAQRLPDNLVKERIRKLKRNYQRKGLKPGVRKLTLCRWNIFITNVSENQLNGAQIHSTYALRWQIELIFKLSKSGMGVHLFHSKKPARIFVELYAKLICLVLLLYFCGHTPVQTNKKISFLKAYKYFFFRAVDFINAVTSFYNLKRFTKNFLTMLAQGAVKETKKKKLTQCTTGMSF